VSSYPIYIIRSFGVPANFAYMVMLLIIEDKLKGVRTRMKAQQMMMIPASFMPITVTLFIAMSYPIYNLIFMFNIQLASCSAWPKPKLNTKIGLHHPPPPTHHKLFETKLN
jgi:hypothetical protein